MVNSHNRYAYRKIFLNKGNDFLIEGEPMILGKNRKDILKSPLTLPIITEKQSRCWCHTAKLAIERRGQVWVKRFGGFFPQSTASLCYNSLSLSFP